jgi:hypothetical protein
VRHHFIITMLSSVLICLFSQTKKLKPDSDESAEDFYEDELFNWNSDDVVDDVIAQQAAKRQQKDSTNTDDVSNCSSVSNDSDIVMDDVVSLKSEADEDEFTTSETIDERKTKTFDILLDALEHVRKNQKEKIKVNDTKCCV